MSQTKQNPQFFQSQDERAKLALPLGNGRIIDGDDQHDGLNGRLLEARPQDILLRLREAIDVEVHLLDQRERLLKNYEVVITGHTSIIARGRVVAYRQNGGVVIRGGNWDNTTAAGVFARNNNWATNGNTNIGARLARHCHTAEPSVSGGSAAMGAICPAHGRGDRDPGNTAASFPGSPPTHGRGANILKIFGLSQ